MPHFRKGFENILALKRLSIGLEQNALLTELEDSCDVSSALLHRHNE